MYTGTLILVSEENVPATLENICEYCHDRTVLFVNLFDFLNAQTQLLYDETLSAIPAFNGVRDAFNQYLVTPFPSFNEKHHSLILITDAFVYALCKPVNEAFSLKVAYIKQCLFESAFDNIPKLNRFCYFTYTPEGYFCREDIKACLKDNKFDINLTFDSVTNRVVLA